jgi:hypothetical protein
MHMAGRVFNIVNSQDSKRYCISVLPRRRVITHQIQRGVENIPEEWAGHPIFEWARSPERLLFTVEALVAKSRSIFSMLFPITVMFYWVNNQSRMTSDDFGSVACKIVEGLRFGDLPSQANIRFLNTVCEPRSLFWDWDSGITFYSFRRFRSIIFLDRQPHGSLSD